MSLFKRVHCPRSAARPSGSTPSHSAPPSWRGYRQGAAAARTDSDPRRAFTSSRRERMPSLVNTLRRCHSAVRGLRKAARRSPGSTTYRRRAARSAAPAGSVRRAARRSVCAPSRPWPEALAGALGERFHADCGEHLVGRAKLVARVDPAVLATQPLPVEQMSPGELGTQPGAANRSIASRYRRSALSPSLIECPAARLDSQAPVGVAGRGGRHHALERTGRDSGSRSGPPLRSARSMPRGKTAAAVSRRPLVGPRRAPGRSGPAR